MTPQLLGYDARESWLGPAQDWGAAWKPRAVLRRDIVKPLSIERHVWSSVFEQWGMAEPAYTGLLKGLWDDLSRLQEHVGRWVERHRERGTPTVAAFTVLPSKPAAERFAPELWSDVSPRTLDDGWRRVGYDVADGSLTSALVTMRPAEAVGDPEGYSAAWGPALNRWHLFDESERAHDFARHSDRALSEHAPFFVYEVWLTAGSPLLEQPPSD